jgi:nucleoside-diphosphate-sugar epimerase
MNHQRISQDALEGKRRGRSVRFLLTGATGFLGSHIAAELLKRGFRVAALARPANGLGAEARMARLLDWHGVPPPLRRGLEVIEGDITRADLGLGPVRLRSVLAGTDEAIHCASNTSFSERKREEVEAVNSEGLSRLLDFARAGSTYFFHYVSTAFVAGKSAGPCPEALAPVPEFHNVYEETKSRGERMVADACREAGLAFSIYRPSIVYGDSRTGRSLLFNAVYYPVRAAVFLKDVYEKDIRERGGKKAGEMGVFIEPDGTLHLPLRVETAGHAGINLIPVDFFTEAFAALLEEAPGGGVFHVVNPRSAPIARIIDYTCRFFRLSGIRACAPEEFLTRPRNALETLFANAIEAYGPYMKDARSFDTSVSRPILEARGIVCPDFDYGVFSRCMEFAVRTGWGSRLFV